MKLLLCADVRLESDCMEKLSVKQYHKWKSVRMEKFSSLIDRAAQTNANHVILFGSIFGRKRITESVIDDLFTTVKSDEAIHVIMILQLDEYTRINYRSDIPDNLHLLCVQLNDTFSDEMIVATTNVGDTSVKLTNNETLKIRKTEEGMYIIKASDKEETIPFFEPLGFEDADKNTFGYGIIEWDEINPSRYIVKTEQIYAFRTIEIRNLPGDDQKEILRKINSAVSNIGVDTMLRITITGKFAFGIALNSDALKKQLQNRIFYVEIYDNTVMDIDEAAFENDISLRSEFVRLALRDDSLSESERNKIISYGWNALNGKEVSLE